MRISDWSSDVCSSDLVINGQKVFISNGQLCDILVLAAKTDSAAGAKGVSLFLVDTSLPGFNLGQNLAKLGMKAQDTRSAARSVGKECVSPCRSRCSPDH